MLTEAQFRRCAAQVSNWGRWGPDDQLGTLNFITDATIARSARSVRRGKLFSLALGLGADGIWSGSSFRRNPIHLMTVDGGDAATLLDHIGDGAVVGRALNESSWGTRLAKFNDDMIIMPLQAGTQWDALSHVYYDDLLYNGYPAVAVTSAGAAKDSIDQVHAKGVVGRGVLLDVARHRRLDHVPPRTAIEPAELDEIVARHGLSIESGDIVVIRTGWWPQFAALGDGDRWRAEGPGLSWRCAQWLHDHEVAAVAADNVAVEVSDAGPSEVAMPLHLLCLRDMGLMLGELWALDELAADCAAEGTFDFQLIAAPMRVSAAVGAPVSPVALR